MIFWILVIAAFIVFFALVFAVLKSIWKAFVLAVGILFIVFSVTAVLAILDAREFGRQIQSSPHLFLLEEDGRPLAAMEDVMSKRGASVPTEEEFSEYSRLYSEGDYEGLLEDNYRVFVVSTSAFDDLPSGSFGESDSFGKPAIMEMLRSDNAVDVFIDKTIEESKAPKEQIPLIRDKLEDEAPEEAKLRSSLFSLLLQASLEDAGPMYILEEYKEGTISIYPETMLFRFLNYMPSSVLDKAAETANKEGKD
ncbi:MAG: hypothetical protein R6U32_05165 [Candidatus Woesearchaeota archaeon]